MFFAVDKIKSLWHYLEQLNFADCILSILLDKCLPFLFFTTRLGFLIYFGLFYNRGILCSREIWTIRVNFWCKTHSTSPMWKCKDHRSNEKSSYLKSYSSLENRSKENPTSYVLFIDIVWRYGHSCSFYSLFRNLENRFESEIRNWLI